MAHAMMKWRYLWFPCSSFDSHCPEEFHYLSAQYLLILFLAGDSQCYWDKTSKYQLYCVFSPSLFCEINCSSQCHGSRFGDLTFNYLPESVLQINTRWFEGSFYRRPEKSNVSKNVSQNHICNCHMHYVKSLSPQNLFPEKLFQIEIYLVASMHSLLNLLKLLNGSKKLDMKSDLSRFLNSWFFLFIVLNCA